MLAWVKDESYAPARLKCCDMMTYLRVLYGDCGRGVSGAAV